MSKEQGVGDGTMLTLFAVTIFTSASLLFVVQPMVGKMILPHLGGSSSVWTTCMLFFQAILLAGYIYAHGIADRLSTRHQVSVHMAIMGLAILVSLPLGVPESLLRSDSLPAFWLLTALLAGVGLPLFIVSSSAPLFQHWFAGTSHPDADDPYHLYAASNLGSMLALLAYPFLLEPSLRLPAQSWSWSIGFGLLTLLAGGCGWLALQQAPDGEAEAAGEAKAPTNRSADPLGWARRARWVLWAFIPSSLMLGVTQYLTTDIASVPLMWVVPLALYLASFIAVFARRPLRLPDWSRSLLPLTVPITLVVSVSDVSMSWIIASHLAMFALFALFFHGELAADRPATTHLTEFYIWMSVGGAAGGLFNALLAPVLFDRTIEYTLVLAFAAAVILPNAERIEDEFTPSWPVPAALAPVGLFYLWMIDYMELGDWWTMLISVCTVGVGLAVGVLYPKWENAAIAAVILLSMSTFSSTPGAIEYERSFFAGYTVFEREYYGHRFVKFSHGTTSHGVQSTDEELESTPLAYHHPSGPVGDVIEAVDHRKVGVLGLGAGAMAAYAEPGTHFTFFEIDPTVEAIAREHFTYLDQCGDRCTVEIGDGRQLLEETAPDTFDILFLDAYNSDSVPTHLMTREALQLYMSRIDEDGVLVFNVSNRYLDIEGIVGTLAEDAGLVSLTRLHGPTRELKRQSVYTSMYAVVARDKQDLGPLYDNPGWEPTPVNDVLWTDNYTDIVSIVDF